LKSKKIARTKPYLDKMSISAEKRREIGVSLQFAVNGPRLGRQPQGQVEKRYQVQRVVVEHDVHVALEPGTDVIGIRRGNRVARDVGLPMAAANVPLQRLQPAIGKVAPPPPAGMVKDVQMLD
jgi:hypothetical protein